MTEVHLRYLAEFERGLRAEVPSELARSYRLRRELLELMELDYVEPWRAPPNRLENVGWIIDALKSAPDWMWEALLCPTG